jgi:tetratricopeptide (TPR) repeat protein
MRKISLLLTLMLMAGCGSDAEQAGDANPKQGTAAKSTSSKNAPEKGGETEAASKTHATAVALLERGKAYIEQRQAAKAIESLSQAIGLNAENSEAFYQRARAHALARQDASALADYSAAIRLDPKRARLYYSRGYFYLSRRFADKAIVDLKKSIALDPNEIEPIQFLGLAHVAKKEYQQAIAAFDKALKLKPESSDVYNNRGFTFLQAKQFDKALKDFQQAIKLNTESVNAYNNMGLTYFAMEDYRSSASSFTKAIERSPNTPNFYRQRREAYLKLGMQSQADADEDKLTWLKQLAVLNIALARQPRNSAKYVERAHHLLDGGEESAALEDFNRAVKADPQYAKALSARAAYWLGKNKLDRVIDDCNNAIDIQPHQEAYSIRGDAWMQKGDYERALADFVKAKRFDATVAQAYLMRARALKSQGDDEQARKSFERAVALDPSIEKSLQ